MTAPEEELLREHLLRGHALDVPSSDDLAELREEHAAAHAYEARLSVEGELLAPLDPHAVSRTEYRWGIAVVCACGQWECAVTGPASAAWARRDHERHRTLAG